jgi:hypothetical protein
MSSADVNTQLNLNKREMRRRISQFNLLHSKIYNIYPSVILSGSKL